ncbi:MAG: OsmC family protein [bacterium]|nr:OsmC family protein [bacterium]
MSQKEHKYTNKVIWTGNKGEGTATYSSYNRNHTLSIEHKLDILCSADTPFRGDGTKHNPEDMLLYALSSCHMLWFLHFCADNGIVVTAYVDQAEGLMIEKEGGGGYFKEVTLNPSVTITNPNQIDLANSLHQRANEKCFIANSCNFPVKHRPVCIASND